MILRWTAWVYGKVMEYRNKRFDSNQASICSFSIPIISIGNVSVGGTGKTPFTIFVADIAQKLGKNVVIITRGYGRKTKGQVIVSDGNSILVSTEQGGDEAVLLAQKTGVPVIANADRCEGARYATDMFEPDCIILDDAFQHRHIHRDLDIVLVDESTIQNPYVLPQGRLRESLSALRRADVVCATNLSLERVVEHTEQFFSGTTLPIQTRIEIGKIYEITEITLSVESFTQGASMVVCGIAHPERFIESLLSKNVNIVAKKTFSDHHTYTKNDVDTIIRECKEKKIVSIITTEKDVVKLSVYTSKFQEQEIALLVLPIALKIVNGESEFRKIISQVLQ